MSGVHGTHKNPSQEALQKRFDVLTADVNKLEKEFFEAGVPIPGISWPDMTQFNFRAKLQLIFEVLRELSDKSDLEMDIRLREIQITMLQELRPAMEQAKSQALADEILRGVQGRGLDNGTIS